MKVLIVDDDKGILHALEATFISCGYEVLIANRPGEALVILINEEQKGKRVDLLVTDYRMHGMNGLTLIKEIKRQQPYMPAILMTAFGTDTLDHDIKEMECCRFVEKPFQIPKFMKIAEELTGSRCKAA